MSKSRALPLTIRALSRWPADPLRPEVQFQDAILRRAERRASDPKTNEASEIEQANALFSLVENRYSNKYSISKDLIKPASNPTYYDDLVHELEAATQRGWFASRLNRWKGFLRWT